MASGNPEANPRRLSGERGIIAIRAHRASA